jgi:DNA (cytosine-5)-methyltransferase 1
VAAYYNEIDPYCAAWLRNLIAAGHIAPGDVDERDIRDVRPDDLRGYIQCHFFAGIGVWSSALRLAGWPDDRPVWTGSCPCQPFSTAGKGIGFDDERHLWPAWQWLIGKRRPAAIIGEQVASKDVEPWIDLVSTDLEGMGYAIGTMPFPSAGVGAPHIRDRTYFVAHTYHARSQGRQRVQQRPIELFVGAHSVAGVMADSDIIVSGQGRSINGGRNPGSDAQSRSRLGSRIVLSELANTNGGNTSAEREQCSGEYRQFASNGIACELEHAGGVGRQWRETAASGHEHDGTASEWPQSEYGAGLSGSHRLHQHTTGPTNGFWRDADWLFCRDGKWRPVEPGTFPLAHGATSRVGRLRAYGNAINREAAATFIEAAIETIDA